MDITIRQDIFWQPDKKRLLQRLRLADDQTDEDYQTLMLMLDQAKKIARPKYAYGLAAVQEKYPAAVLVEGILLESSLLRKNLDQAYRIIPYLASCGTELEEWSQQYDDILESYWADEIKSQALRQAVKELRQEVKTGFFAGRDMSQMSPGSLPQWPISAQKEIFLLMQDALPALGIHLTDSCLMLPGKSVSGFYFSSEVHFENCALCPRPTCPERRAVYRGAFASPE